jgi:hypothetical protein
MDLSYLLLPNLINNNKTGYILYDIIIIVTIIVCIKYINTFIEDISFYTSALYQYINDKKIKSKYIITVIQSISPYGADGNCSNIIPVEYLAVVYYMSKNSIDLKYCKNLISTQNNISNLKLLEGISEEIKNSKRKEARRFHYIIDYSRAIKICPNIYFQSHCVKNDILITEEKRKTTNSRNDQIYHEIEIFSDKYTFNELKSFIHLWIDEYESYLKNINNDKLYFLSYCCDNSMNDGNNKNKGRDYDSEYDYNEKKSKSDETSLSYYQFVTNKNFDNIFFEQKSFLKKKLDFFLNNENQYKRLGQQYSFGILLYGEPGCGKTSTIKAIAKYTNRHILEIPLSRIETYEELHKLIFTESYDSINLGFKNKILLLEDVDCMTNVIKKRTKQMNTDNEIDDETNAATNNNDNNNDNNDDNDDNDDNNDDNDFNADLDDDVNNDTTKKSDNCDNDNAKKKAEGMNIFVNIPKSNKSQEQKKKQKKFTLSEILNLFDGVLEQNGRIIIMTSNHPEKIDPALLRFGRIDVKIHYKKCNSQITKDIVEFYFETQIDEQIILPAYKFTASEIFEICSKYDSVDETIEHILNNSSFKLYESQ